MSYKVSIRSSGTQFEVQDGETVLEAALRQGIVVPYSCRSGSCGTCKARVQGQVDYGDYEPSAMSEQERAEGMALLCQARPLSDLVVDAREVVAAEQIEIKILPCRVTELELLAHDVMGLGVQLPKNQAFNYLAGQYIDILLRDGRRRSFSMATPADDSGQLQFHIRRVPDGSFTNSVFTELKPRDLLRFQGPFGTYFLREDSTRPMVLMAGGTGFAPIKAIVEYAGEREIVRPMHLFWGVRSRRDLYMHELAQSWQQGRQDFQYTPVLSEPGDGWSGLTGWVHQAVLEHYPDLSGHEVYASGPPPMIEAAKQTFFKQGLAEDALYFDSFEFAHRVGTYE